MADRKNILTVKELCELAGVSRSGYYNWVRSERARETREQRDRADFEWILEAYRFRSYAKSARGIHMRLLHMGVRMNVKKIRRLMRKYRLTCPIRKPNPYRRLQRSIRMGSTAENLVNREFESRGPRAILLTDITYIPLNGKFCYLSTILDACTKQVLSYAMSKSLEVDFVLEMVERLAQNPRRLAEQRDCDPQRPVDTLYQLEVHSTGGEPGTAPVHVPQGQLLGTHPRRAFSGT